MALKFVNFWKSRLVFISFYSFWMFVNKLFTYLTCLYLKALKVFSCEIFDTLFSCEDDDIGRFSNLHYTFIYVINPFHATGLFLYPLETSEKLWFSDVFRGYRKRLVAWNGLSTAFSSRICSNSNSMNNYTL